MSNLTNKILQEYRRLGSGKYRKKSRKVILEGYHLLDEALEAGIDVETVLFTTHFLQKETNRELLNRAGEKARLMEVAPRLFHKIAQTENPQGVGAIACLPFRRGSLPAQAQKEQVLNNPRGSIGSKSRSPGRANIGEQRSGLCYGESTGSEDRFADRAGSRGNSASYKDRLPDREKGEGFGQRDAAFYLILDGLQDPGNLGTIIRTAAAASINGIFLLPGTVDPYNPKTLRASLGGIFYLPVTMLSAPQDEEACFSYMAEQGIQLVAADPAGKQPYHTLDFSSRPHAVIIGNENKGVRDSLLHKAEIRASIPLSGKITALNAAVAASIFIFENQRQREGKGKGV